MNDTATISTVDLDKRFENGCSLLSNRHPGARSRCVAGHGCGGNGGIPINSKHPLNLFPCKLRRLLEDAAKEHNEHIISWLPDGKSFKVHDPVTFTNKLLGRYFSQKCFSSFTRQLYHYGFSKIDANGNFKTSFYHPKFQRDNNLSYMTMERKNARAHRFVPTTRPLHCGSEDYAQDDNIPCPAMKGRPPGNAREPSKNPLPSCLFFVDDESCTKDHEHDESHSDVSILGDSLNFQNSSAYAPSPPPPAAAATSSTTLVGASIITRNRSSNRNSIQIATPAVSCPMPSCMLANPYSKPNQNQENIESSFMFDAPSPILDDKAWAMTLMAIHNLNQNDEQEQLQHPPPLVENDETSTSQSPKPSRDDDTRDWLTILETLPWSCDEAFASDDLNGISRSGTLEPRSLEDMVQYPIRIEEFSSREGGHSKSNQQ